MSPVERLQPPRYNFGVFTLPPWWLYTSSYRIKFVSLPTETKIKLGISIREQIQGLETIAYQTKQIAFRRRPIQLMSFFQAFTAY